MSNLVQQLAYGMMLALAATATTAQADVTAFECQEETVLDASAPLFVSITLTDARTTAIVQVDKGTEAISAPASVSVRNASQGGEGVVYLLELEGAAFSADPLAVVEFSTVSGHGAVEFLSGTWRGWWNFLTCTEI